MADRYVGVSATGGGNGTSGSRWTLAQMNALLAAGDRAIVGPGTYAGGISLANAGTSDTSRITIEAEDVNNKPIFDGASNAVTGASATAPLTAGWAPANGNGILTYASGPNSGSGDAACVYSRNYSGGFYGVTLGDPDVDSGIFYNLWDMVAWTHATSPNYDHPNPDARMHDTGGHSDGSDDLYLDTGRVMHDYRGQCMLAGGVLSIRLDSPAGNANANPANRQVWIVAQQWGVSLVSRPYITLRNLIFRRFKSLNFDGCPGLVLEGCEVRQMQWTGCWITGGSNNAVVRDCIFKAVANSSGHYEDGLHVKGSSNGIIEGCTFAWAGHSAILISNSSPGWTVRNNTVRDSHSGISFDTGDISNEQVFNNDVSNCGILGNMRVHMAPHPGLQLQKCVNSRFWRNRVRDCGYCVFMTAGLTGVDIANNRLEHNTFSRGEVDTIHMIAYSGGRIYNNAWTNNIFEGPSGGDSGNRRSLINRQVIGTWDGNTFRYNLYYHPGYPAVVVLSDSPGSYTNVLGAGGAAGAYPSVFGTTSAEKGVEADPKFMSSTDVHLQATSPAIGAGLVIAGESYNGTPDIGAYEYVTGGNQPPTATIVSISSRTPVVNTSVSFQGSGSDPDGTIASYAWNFGDGATSTSQNPSHTYTATGTFTVRLTVTDNGGATSAEVTDTITVRSASSASQIPFLGSNCSASSSQATPNYGPAGAVDGNDLQTSPLVDTGRWVANSGVDPNLTLPQWWQTASVDLYRVEEARIQCQKADAGRVYVFDLDLSPDGTTWTRVATDAQSSISGDFYTVLTFSPVEARYHRVTLKSNSNNNQFAGLWEYKAFGTLVAAGGGDTSSAYTIAAGNVTDTLGTSAASRYAPGTVVDGKRGRATDPPWCWSARIRAVDGSPLSVGLIFNLGSSKPVGRVRIAPYRPSRYLYALNVATSPDGTTWTDRFPANQATGRAEWSEFAFTPVSAQYVRVMFTGENLTGRPSIVRVWEAEIYPA